MRARFTVIFMMIESGAESFYKNLPHSGKPYKKKVSRGDQTKIPNRVGIEQRPAIADEKTEFGHSLRAMEC